MWLTATGWACFVLATLVAAINFYRSFLRYPVFRWLGREYKWQSGYPAIGTVLLVFAILCLGESTTVMWSALAVAIIDTGGIPWFILMMAWMGLREVVRGKQP